MKSKITSLEHTKIMLEIQAGNCGNMSRLTYNILCKMVPPGIKVQMRATTTYKNFDDHQFVTLKPTHAVHE